MRLVEVLVYLVSGMLAIPALMAGVIGAATFDTYEETMKGQRPWRWARIGIVVYLNLFAFSVAVIVFSGFGTAATLAATLGAMTIVTLAGIIGTRYLTPSKKH